ncbi:MAG: quinolinate synthase NadA [Nitrospirae bacterium]|nr:quinolinate synthase NadA [Nitrospirota bacterium]
MVSTEQELTEKILKLKAERKAVILSHNYQVSEIQDLADFVGDSLELSQQAAKTGAEVIVFCGVHFMAETAAIICPDKTVLIPDLEAGCSMSDMITVEQLHAFKAQHPGAVVVCYVNSTAAIKAESDICCTSSNAVRFRIMAADLLQAKAAHPKAEVFAHPECTSEVTSLADQVASTSGISRAVKASSASEVIIATETGILHRIEKENPTKKVYAACQWCDCAHMKVNTLEKLLWSLEDMQYVVTVPEEIRVRAKRAIDRMLVLG